MELFDELIEPTLSTQASFESISKKLKWGGSDLYYNLALTISLIQKFPAYKGYMIKFSKMIKKAFKPSDNLIKNLVMELAENMKKFRAKKNSDPLLDLIRYRVDYLKAEVEKCSVNGSWKMPKVELPDYKEIEKFFRGSERELVYTNFKSVTQAEKFVHKHQWSFSCDMKIEGHGKDTKLILTKRKTHFYQKFPKVRDLAYELDKIENLDLDL